MSQRICAKCKRELRGAREICIIVVGPFLLVLLMDTPDCNWRNCTICGRAICKTCYSAEMVRVSRNPHPVMDIASLFQ
jgi:hypothetical protein